MNNKEILRGLREIAPLLMGVVPMGIAVGIYTVENGFSVFQSMSMSLLIFAGAAQVAAVDLIVGGAPLWIILSTAILINIRFIMYGASIATYLSKASATFKVLLSYGLTDMAFLVTTDPKKTTTDRVYYYVGAALAVWVVWQVSFFLGAFFGAIVPEDWPLAFALPLAFIFFTVSRLVSMANIVAAFVSGLGAIILIPVVPLHAGLILAILLGAVAGYTVKRLLRKRGA